MRRMLRPLPLAMAACAGLIGLRAADLARAPAPPGAQAAPAREAPQAPAAEPPRSVAPTQSLLDEPAPLADAAERALLMDLRARRLELDRRERAIADRELMLGAIEQRVAARVEELSALQQRLDAMARAQRDRSEAGWRGLVRTYEAMRPRDAAAIFNELDLPVLLEVLDRMKENRAAPVLGVMQPERARQVTAELAQKRQRAARGE